MPKRRSTFHPALRRAATVVVAALALGGLAFAGEADLSSSAEQTYLVRAGDSLWSISRSHGVTMQQLAAANGMRLSDVLLIGRRLAIPVAGVGARAAGPVGAGAGAATVAPTNPSGCPAAGGGGPYGVLPAMSRREAQLRPVFVEWADAYGVSPALIEAIAWEESGWQEGVVSAAHAVGVGQLLPATATFVSHQLIGQTLDIHSADDNIRMMARFVSYLADRENGNLCDTIAAYYEGPGNVAEHGVLTVSRLYIADVEALVPRFE